MKPFEKLTIFLEREKLPQALSVSIHEMLVCVLDLLKAGQSLEILVSGPVSRGGKGSKQQP